MGKELISYEHRWWERLRRRFHRFHDGSDAPTRFLAHVPDQGIVAAPQFPARLLGRSRLHTYARASRGKPLPRIGGLLWILDHSAHRISETSRLHGPARRDAHCQPVEQLDDLVAPRDTDLRFT
jgi:hypothetical protein